MPRVGNNDGQQKFQVLVNVTMLIAQMMFQ